MSQADSYVAEITRLCVLLVLIAAVAGKGSGMAQFRQTLADLFRLPARAAAAAALAVLSVEALTAALVAGSGDWARIGMSAALLLFALFTGAILVALAQRRAVSCNCFGGRGHVISIFDVVRNMVLIAACAFYLLTAPRVDPLAFEIWLLLLGMAAILFLILADLDDIAWAAR